MHLQYKMPMDKICEQMTEVYGLELILLREKDLRHIAMAEYRTIPIDWLSKQN